MFQQNAYRLNWKECCQKNLVQNDEKNTTTVTKKYHESSELDYLRGYRMIINTNFTIITLI